MNKIKTNPYVYTKEIIESKLFAGRKRELEIIEEELSNFSSGQIMRNLALTGVQRIGKTSILLRIVEICDKKKIFPVKVTIQEKHAKNPWEFWCEVYKRIIAEATNKGIVESRPGESLNFWLYDDIKNKQAKRECHLLFEEEYSEYKKGHIMIKSPDESLIQRDMTLIMKDLILDKKFSGMVLMFDEAQKFQEFQESRDIKESLRNIFTSNIDKVGLMFAGLERLGSIFVGPNEPFNGRGHTIPITNFTLTDDIRQCVLQPIKEEEGNLLSPMTMDYIVLLSQGMPNFIRMICYAIYERYRKNKQKDLNLTIDIMDDLLDAVERDVEVQGKMHDLVNKVKGLSSIDLEILYSLARYPKWNVEEVVDLDESFRGESKSKRAIERRKKLIEDKKKYFIEKGLLEDVPDKLVISGGEFVSDYLGLYLRFWYEVQKYGELSRKLVVGKGPQTTFGEKTDKLSDAISWEVKNIQNISSEPGIIMSIFHPEYRDQGQLVVDRVLDRYKMFDQVKKGTVPVDEKYVRVLLQCMEVCKFVDKPGSYLLVCLSARNRDNHRELMQLELYFKVDITEPYVLNLGQLMDQAKDTQIAIEGYAQTLVELPDIKGLCEQFGSTIDEFLNILKRADKWLINSVQNIITEKEEKAKEDKEDIIDGKWIEEYRKNHMGEAENILNTKIALCLGSDSKKLAHLYNDRGYMYSGDKNRYSDARNDLELAFDYHYSQLSITLLNLAFVDIMENHIEPAIDKIENVLIITDSREEIAAGYLRTIMPECNMAFMKNIWEHRPANVLEVSYILFAYAIYRRTEKNCEGALAILNEGLEILPSSSWLKHALARYYLSEFQAPKADEIYQELSKISVKDKGLEWEIQNYLKLIPKKLQKK